MLSMKQHEVTTLPLTEAFMEMDASLSRTQAAVGDCHTAGDFSIDMPWNGVTRYIDQAISTYLSLTAPDAKVSQKDIDQGTKLVQLALNEISNFRTVHGHRLNAGMNAVIKAAAEAQRAQEESARRAREAAEEASKALGSVSTRLQATQTRLIAVPASLSVLYREFPAASSADLVNNEATAQTHIATATDCLGRARSAQHNGDPEGALTLARQMRTELGAAEQLIGAVHDRLQRLRELQLQPEQPSMVVRFALHDAQMFCVDHGLTKQWASVLDAQLVRIETLEASLKVRSPDYWAYTNGLDKVNDFIQSVVVKMRQDIKR